MTDSPTYPICTQIDPDPKSFCSIDYTPWGYVPSLIPAAIFVPVFAILLFAHVGQFIHYRFRQHHPHANFTVLASICALGEVLGWCLRLYGHYDVWNFNVYVAQICCLIITPVFISAYNYVVFCKLMDQVGHQWSAIPRKLYIKLFVIGDVISLVLQGTGGGLNASGGTNMTIIDLGKWILIAGVSFQVLVTAPFLLLFLDYQRRRPRPRFDTLSMAILVSTAAILIRCIFRVAEMSGGWHGPLAKNEYLFSFLDGMMIALATGIFVLIHPCRYLQQLPLDGGEGYSFDSEKDNGPAQM